MSKSNKLDVEEYNRAVDAIANTVAQLGMNSGEEEDGFPPICRLNVGGQEFAVHREHLRSQPGSVLTAVFMGEEECEFDDQGRFFFDHDPSNFNLVLNYMRSGECVIPYERGAFESFQKDVGFWRLDVLEARCDVHFNKYIKPQLSGEASTGKGGAAGKKGKGPSGKAVYAKFASKQKDMHGALVDKLAEAVHASLMDGAANGFNTLTLTSFRPPETIGVPGLPLFKTPDWTASSAPALPGMFNAATTLYCWDPTFAPLFQPVAGFPLLNSTRDYVVTRLEEYGFKASARFEQGSGIVYDISAMADE